MSWVYGYHKSEEIEERKESSAMSGRAFQQKYDSMQPARLPFFPMGEEFEKIQKEALNKMSIDTYGTMRDWICDDYWERKRKRHFVRIDQNN